jgi:uncharacterized protein
MKVIKTERPWALITGASRGIGLALAQSLASEGYDLVLTARDVDDLSKAADRIKQQTGVEVRLMPMDLVQPDAPTKLYEEINQSGITIDLLINNAGLGVYGHFINTPLEDELQMMQLNMLALTALSKRFLKPMIQRSRGHIVNIASLAAYQPGGPGFAVYYATKSYVLSFSKALALELRGSGVHVTAVCPGPVATAFEDRSGAADSWLYRLPKNTPEKIAGSVCRAIKTHRSVVLPGIFSKLLAFAGEMPPRRIALEVNNLLLRSSR